MYASLSNKNEINQSKNADGYAQQNHVHKRNVKVTFEAEQSFDNVDGDV